MKGKEKKCTKESTNQRECLSLVSFAWTHSMPSFPICIVLFFLLYPVVFCPIRALTQYLVKVAFVNPLINELCMYVCMPSSQREALPAFRSIDILLKSAAARGHCSMQMNTLYTFNCF